MQLLARNELHEAVWQDPDRLSGEPCFRGTRVPVRVLFEYLAAGAPLSEFLEAFPSVSAQQVDTVLRGAERLLMDALICEV